MVLVVAHRCDNITIAPALLKQLEGSMEPLERKLWPTMGGCDESKVDLTAGQVSQRASSLLYTSDALPYLPGLLACCALQVVQASIVQSS